MNNTSITSIEHVPGRSAFIITVDSCLLIFVNLFSFLGNLFILLAIYRNKKLHTTTNIFIINLALSDILMSIFVMPLSCVASIEDQWILESFGCRFFDLVGYILAGVSLQTLILIAYNRYVRVVQAGKYSRIYTKINVVRMVVCSWIVTASVVGIGFPLAGVEFEELEGNPAICVAHCENIQSITYVSLVLALYLIPCGTIIPLSYFRVYREISNHNAAIALSLNRRNSSHGIEEAKITKIFAAVLLGFCLCWLPAFLSTTLYVFGVLHHEALIYSNIYWTVPLYTSCFINPIIYTAMSTPFRDELIKIVTCK